MRALVEAERQWNAYAQGRWPEPGSADPPASAQKPEENLKQFAETALDSGGLAACLFILRCIVALLHLLLCACLSTSSTARGDASGWRSARHVLVVDDETGRAPRAGDAAAAGRLSAWSAPKTAKRP
jgi:hypothetical protein